MFKGPLILKDKVYLLNFLKEDLDDINLANDGIIVNENATFQKYFDVTIVDAPQTFTFPTSIEALLIPDISYLIYCINKTKLAFATDINKLLGLGNDKKTFWKTTNHFSTFWFTNMIDVSNDDILPTIFKFPEADDVKLIFGRNVLTPQKSDIDNAMNKLYIKSDQAYNTTIKEKPLFYLNDGSVLSSSGNLKWVSPWKIDKTMLETLWKRFTSINRTKPYKIQVSEFYRDVYTLILLYSSIGNRDSHLSILPNVIRNINFDVELFGNPFNVVAPNYCSAYSSMEKNFGALSNYFNYQFVSGKKYWFNPIQGNEFIYKAINRLIDQTSKVKNVYVAGLLPIWKDLKGWKELIAYEKLIDFVEINTNKYHQYNVFDSEVDIVKNVRLYLFVICDKENYGKNGYPTINHITYEWATKINIRKTYLDTYTYRVGNAIYNTKYFFAKEFSKMLNLNETEEIFYRFSKLFITFYLESMSSYSSGKLIPTRFIFSYDDMKRFWAMYNVQQLTQDDVDKLEMIVYDYFIRFIKEIDVPRSHFMMTNDGLINVIPKEGSIENIKVFDVSPNQLRVLKKRHKGRPLNFIKNVITIVYIYTAMNITNYHLSIPPKMLEKLNINVELFGSPLNTELHSFCSLFPEIENVFGSVGNYFDYELKSGLNYSFNPPYIHEFMIESSKRLKEQLMKTNDYFVFGVIPAWTEPHAFKIIKTIPTLKGSVILKQIDHKFYDYYSDSYISVTDSILFVITDRKVYVNIEDCVNIWKSSSG